MLSKKGEVGLKASQELVTFYYNYATDLDFRRRANIQAKITAIIKKTKLQNEETKLLRDLADATATYITARKDNQEVQERLATMQNEKGEAMQVVGQPGGKRHRKTKKHHKKSQKKYRKKSHKRHHKKQ